MPLVPALAFTLRPYRESDFDRLWRIDQVCYEPAMAYSRLELGWYIHLERSFTLVAEASVESGKPAEILGFLVARQDGRGLGHVITIDVLPEARRAGLGSVLMQAAERCLCDAGCRRISLEIAVNNQAAFAFYRRLGYSVVRTQPRYYSNGVDALVLEKEFPA